MAIERCNFCGVSLNVTSQKWKCTCGRIYEYAEIIEDWTESYRECSGLGLSNRRKWLRIW